MALIEAKSVVKEYRVGKVRIRALRGVNLMVNKGEFLCIMGPSGSGKSTLLNMLGLLDEPTSGEVHLHDQPTDHLTYAEAARHRRESIGFIFQSFNLFPVLSAYENVEYPLLFRAVSRQERTERVMQALADVRLSEVAAHRPDELSGGQQQRVAIARALVTHPLFVLADEPTANLDSESTEIIMNIMQRLNREQRMTFIFSTHDPRVMHHATRIITLKDGHIEDDEIKTNIKNIFSQRLPQ